MRSWSPRSFLFAVFAAFALIAQLACGGGGGGGGHDVPSHTLTLVSSVGTKFSVTSLTVSDGATSTATLTLDAGYEQPSVSATAGDRTTTSSLASTSDVHVWNVTFGPVRADTTFTASATAFYIASFVSSEAVTFSVASVKMDASGYAATDVHLLAPGTVTLVPSDGTTKVSVSDTSDSLTKHVRVGPLTKDCTFTPSVTWSFVDLPANPFTVACIIDPQVEADMHDLIRQWGDAVAQQHGVNVVYWSGYTDPKSIRNYLIGLGPNLRFAEMLGEVPIVRRSINDMTLEDGLPSTSDNYYKALAYPFNDPVPCTTYGDDGTYVIPGTLDLAHMHINGAIEYAPIIAVSRVTGLSKATKLADIRAFLEKDLRLRDPQTQAFHDIKNVNAFDWADGGDLVYPVAETEAAFVNHPLLWNGSYTMLYDADPKDLEAAFIAALRNCAYVTLNCHATATEATFYRPHWKDGELYVPDTSVFFGADVRARFVHYQLCDAGDFAIDGNTAMRSVLSGETLCVGAATTPSRDWGGLNIERAYSLEYALGVGRCAAFAFPFLQTGEWEHLYGDPTITMAHAPVSDVRLVVAGKRFVGEQVVSLSATMPAPDGNGLYVDVAIANVGSQELRLYAQDGESARYVSPLTVDGPSGTLWARWSCTGFTGFVSEHVADTRVLTVAPGDLRVLRVLVKKSVATQDGPVVVSGPVRAFFDFTCNDPNVGAFRLDVSAVIP